MDQVYLILIILNYFNMTNKLKPTNRNSFKTKHNLSKRITDAAVQPKLLNSVGGKEYTKWKIYTFELSQEKY